MDLCTNILHLSWDAAPLSKGYILFKIKLKPNSLKAVQCVILLCDKITKKDHFKNPSQLLTRDWAIYQ